MQHQTVFRFAYDPICALLPAMPPLDRSQDVFAWDPV
jgi:hypothetical protein